MQEVTEQIELINLRYEERWLKDIRILGLSLSLFANYTQKSNGYLVILNYQYQFTAIFRNSILCKNLRPQLGANNHMCNIRRAQLTIFHRYADDQVVRQRSFFTRTQSLASLENALRITRALIELGFVTNNDFFDIEYYKRQDEVLTKILIDTRNATKREN